MAQQETGPEWTAERVRALVRLYPDFPKAGVAFYDVMPILREPRALGALSHLMWSFVIQHTSPFFPTAVVGLDARGFLFGPRLAAELSVPFVPVRKAGKLPGETVSVLYAKEYGTDSLEIQCDALKAGDRVVIVDDTLATGGTATAARDLVLLLGATVSAYCFVVEVPGLGGRTALGEDAQVYSLV